MSVGHPRSSAVVERACRMKKRKPQFRVVPDGKLFGIQSDKHGAWQTVITGFKTADEAEAAIAKARKRESDERYPR